MKEKTKKKERKQTPAFTALIQDGTNALHFSYGSAENKDEAGNEIAVYIWVNGDWKVSIKTPEGKRLEYIIPIEPNVNALLDWLKETGQL